MKRRTVVKSLMIMAGGIAILPSCSHDPGKASIELKNIDITAEQEALLAEIAETIIPKNDMPGAKDLKLHLFTLKMVDDCYVGEDQKSFIVGLNAIDSLARQKYTNVFAACSLQQKIEMLNTITKDDTPSKEIKTFIDITKNKVIQGFMNSKFVMTDLKRYELIPGRYNGYFKV